MFAETARGQQAYREVPLLLIWLIWLIWLSVHLLAAGGTGSLICCFTEKPSPLYLIVVQAWGSEPSAATHTLTRKH